MKSAEIIQNILRKTECCKEDKIIADIRQDLLSILNFQSESLAGVREALEELLAEVEFLLSNRKPDVFSERMDRQIEKAKAALGNTKI